MATANNDSSSHSNSSMAWCIYGAPGIPTKDIPPARALDPCKVLEPGPPLYEQAINVYLEKQPQ
jgi:hypothetical protein